ncbi:hypothetical protein PoB_007573300 [Plakobranchus ocellatus]|uniref:Uncharacterized protein n=1 Tax=Plakobranchus ocellatus TaxID=259542 RepID=A0AAV4DXZ3_9GAST|nr:hypothetical protein PoB_007573300 [Plakobranchus ocellatus]
MVWAHYSLIWMASSAIPRDLASASVLSHLVRVRMQGTVNGGRRRRRGRQKKRWDDNIREWTGLELRNIVRKAEDRVEWKAVVKRSSAAPRRIPNLRDR